MLILAIDQSQWLIQINISQDVDKPVISSWMYGQVAMEKSVALLICMLFYWHVLDQLVCLELNISARLCPMLKHSNCDTNGCHFQDYNVAIHSAPWFTERMKMTENHMLWLSQLLDPNVAEHLRTKMLESALCHQHRDTS